MALLKVVNLTITATTVTTHPLAGRIRGIWSNSSHRCGVMVLFGVLHVATIPCTTLLSASITNIAHTARKLAIHIWSVALLLKTKKVLIHMIINSVSMVLRLIQRNLIYLPCHFLHRTKQWSLSQWIYPQWHVTISIHLFQLAPSSIQWRMIK